PGDRAENGRLARARRSHDRDELAASGVEADAGQDRARPASQMQAVDAHDDVGALDHDVVARQCRSRRRASAASGSDIARYSAAHNVPGITQLPRLVAKICVCLVSSSTVSTETSEESFSIATKSFVIGASASLKACGPRTSVSTWRSLRPSVRAASS